MSPGAIGARCDGVALVQASKPGNMVVTQSGAKRDILRYQEQQALFKETGGSTEEGKQRESEAKEKI